MSEKAAVKKEISELINATEDHYRACDCRLCLRARLGIAVLSGDAEASTFRTRLDKRPLTVRRG